ncbi:glycoside hydrolase family 18 protein [Auriscalpium vulgare]|uniref:Glycoside hydrolase family 18 protein n=1 Tax=Auriscalpium vulgare TaxID=40419 RepID=A0ACB8S5C4_9AGAM|nr:glycoside hydrolase family 18 protein [Auriscalpium vulgare]
MSAAYELVATSDTDTASYPPTSDKQSAARSYRRIFALFVALAVVALGSYKLGQWSVPRRSSEQAGNKPAAASSPTNGDLETPSENSTKPTMSGGKLSVGYFVNWGIYGRKYPPSSVPVQDLTHILYAFANVRETGEVFLSDDWADKDIHYPSDSWNDSGNNLYGNLKALYLLKKANRHLKILLSIGGWSYSAAFHPVVVNPAKRSEFARSAVRLLEDFGFDGLDVDYEYPGNDEQARGYVELLREMRWTLDEHARRKNANYRFLLTIAAPCGPDNYQKLHIREMDQSLDFWNLMAYDFAGSWDKVAGHQANIYGGPINAAQAVQHYTSSGVARPKVILGVPLYGRSFLQTTGPGAPYNGLGQGSWEAGVYDYRALPLPNAHVLRDERAVASWSYDYQTHEMVSFDDAAVGQWKGQWIVREGLGGAMFWELSGDKGGARDGMEGGHGKELVPGPSLVSVLGESMGGLDRSPNWLQYEGSRFDNMRAGMP